MNKDTIRRIHLIYGIVLSIAAVAAGVCLCTACIGIYLSGGEQIYTPEKVSHAFSVIAVPVYLCLALIIGGFVLELLSPAEKSKLKAARNPAVILERLLAKRDIDNCDPALKEQILALRGGRKREQIICLVVLAVCSIGFLCYGMNPANFHQSEINASMIKAVMILFGCLAAPFGCALGCAYRRKSSLEKEIALVKQIPAGNAAPASASKSADPLLAVRCILLCAALGFLIYGFIAGGTADVLTKAINICTECVGLG